MYNLLGYLSLSKIIGPPHPFILQNCVFTHQRKFVTEIRINVFIRADLCTVGLYEGGLIRGVTQVLKKR